MRGISFALIGLLMGETVAVTAQAVYLVDIKFRENGSELIAGRSPVHGMERPNIENTPGSAPGKDIRYALAPFPLRFTKATHTSDFNFDLFPSVVGRPCTLEVEMTLTSSPAALQEWLGNGIPADWMKSGNGDTAEGARAWTPELAAPAPRGFNAVLARYSGSGTADRTVVDSVDLFPEQPALLRLVLPTQAGISRLAFEMPGLRFWLGLEPVAAEKTVWPRGTPAALVIRQPPAEAAPAKRKTSSWKFWRKGG